ncbi:tyrosine-type recombinase/integrase [Neisseria zoodegmatis]|uniref:Tyrosine recombinase XerC n=1 Tax=Neisseria zoodegmatis TaxID=326523 RepID=A0AB38DQE1_9NEIS|nr:tyrosine-type recombinase/integrase [Neisseria zoodegmatis]OSI09752.1 recombinase XerC [Neisseria zoodegmatis]SNU79466.1 tyrosine recombinase XerC [Neisseria zoodegmatis]
MQLSRLFDHQDDYLQTLVQQGKSAHTVAAYRRDLTQLATLLPTDCGQEPAARKHFVAALKSLSQQNTGERSMARKLSAWRQYCGWLVQQGLMAADPTETLKAPKAPERLPKALEQEMLNHLLDQHVCDEALSVRDHALFELMYGSGLRVGEVNALNLSDVLLQEGWVSVTGKGSKQRRVPLTAKSIEAIEAYLPQRVAKDNETALFTNRLGQRLSVRQIRNRLRDWALTQGSPQHISPHMLRHSYASHILQSAQNIRAVQELLGHSNLSTTQIYTKLDFDHLAKVYDDTHPRSKRQKK